MQLKVRSAIFLFGAAVAGGLLAAVAIGLLNVNQIRVGGPIYDRIIQGKDLVADILPPPAYVIESYLEATLALNKSKPLSDTRERINKLKSEYNDRHAFWVKSDLRDDLKTKLLNESHTHVSKLWSAVEEKLLPALDRNDQTAINQAYEQVTLAYYAHRAVVDEIVAGAEAMNIATEAELHSRGFSALLWVLGTLATVLIIVFAGVAMISRGVVSPLVLLTGAIKKLAAGDFDVKVPGLVRRDEIGEMARGVEVLREAGLEKVRLEGLTAEQRKSAEDDRRRNEDEQKRSAAEQAVVVNNIAAGLTRLSEGDLTVRLEAAFPPAYQQLKDDFNAAMSRLQETIVTIVRAVNDIRTSTSEFKQAADDLSKRTEMQAASLEQTAAAVEQITVTVRKTADGANHANSMVSKAKGDAERSGDVVHKAIEAMTAIEGSAKQISQIIGVIDEIAFQTNLLALNAGVEAARAGEAGRGFAVVASEVRSLAQRSAEAAKEIKSLISASTAQVDGGAKLVNETGQVLVDIASQVTAINQVVTEIASSAKEQASGLAQVNTAVNSMDQSTQQNAALVEESNASSHALAAEAEKLADLISTFKVGHIAMAGTAPKGHAAAASAARPAPAKPAPSRPLAHKANGASHPATATMRSGSAALAVKAAPALAEEGWEEF